MHDSVQTGFRNELALEHIIPVCNGKLAGQDECLPVVPVIYDLFKVMLYLAVQLDHPKVIDNQQVMCVQLPEEVCFPSFQMCKLQVLDEHVHREVQYLPAVPACPVTQGTGKVGLPGSCRSGNDDRHSARDVISGCKVGCRAGLYAPCRVRFKFFHRGSQTEAGILYKTLDAVVPSRVTFVLEHDLHAFTQGKL